VAVAMMEVLEGSQMVHEQFLKVPESSSAIDQIFQKIPECSRRFFGPKIF